MCNSVKMQHDRWIRAQSANPGGGTAISELTHMKIKGPQYKIRSKLRQGTDPYQAGAYNNHLFLVSLMAIFPKASLKILVIWSAIKVAGTRIWKIKYRQVMLKNNVLQSAKKTENRNQQVRSANLLPGSANQGVMPRKAVGYILGTLLKRSLLLL